MCASTVVHGTRNKRPERGAGNQEPTGASLLDPKRFVHSVPVTPGSLQVLPVPGALTQTLLELPGLNSLMGWEIPRAQLKVLLN